VWCSRSNLYAQWRRRQFSCLQEGEQGEGRPREKLLQLIWQHQRLRRDQLRTVDGRELRVLHPGFWNREAGPDFHGAVIQFPPAAPVAGDIEIDLEGGGWRWHAHDGNPLYAGVIVHVVWEAPGKSCVPPALELKGVLDASWEELRLCLGEEPLDDEMGKLLGSCGAPLRQLGVPELRDLLRQAALTRLEGKGSQLEARGRQVGWERALWEGLFGGLGYKNNVWPMRLLAELLPVIQTDLRGKESLPLLQARLLGISGLLPAELTRTRTTVDRHLRQLWDAWWREQDRFGGLVLPQKLWRFHNLRPANHPQRRLALGAWWLARGGLVRQLEGWFASEVGQPDLLPSLMKILQVEQDPFWSWHWTFKSRRMRRPQPLLGSQRATDLAVNVILPWLWARAVAGRNETARTRAEERYLAWPPAEDNVLLRQARLRLFGGQRQPLPPSAAHQQALLQILRDFCANSNALCHGCRFPDLVRQLDGR
jgi:hypothetical protein